MPFSVKYYFLCKIIDNIEIDIKIYNRCIINNYVDAGIKGGIYAKKIMYSVNSIFNDS